jgi:hypothetical protein
MKARATPVHAQLLADRLGPDADVLTTLRANGRLWMTALSAGHKHAYHSCSFGQAGPGRWVASTAGVLAPFA